jgi:hypothetical protein
MEEQVSSELKVLPKLLTIRQLTERLFPGVDPPPLWTVRNIAKRGCPHLFLGNKLFFTESAVAEWLETNQIIAVKKGRSSSRKQSHG